MGLTVLISFMGAVLVFAGAALFMPGVPEIPLITDGDWPRLIVMFLGAGWCLLGTFQYFRHGGSWFAKAVLGLVCFIALAAAGLNTFWVLKASYQLPAAIDLNESEPVPAFELTDQNGEIVSDKTLRGKPYVLIFARGAW